MRAAFIVFATLIGAASTGAGCEGAPQTAPADPSEPGVIADPGESFMKVDGFQVGRREVDQVFRNRGVPESMIETVATSPGGYHILENYALATALYRQAVEEGLHEDPQVQLELAFAERQALSRAMQRVLARRALTDERVQKWIEDNMEQFSLPQRQAREIVVGSKAYATELMERLDGGEEFAKLARDHSIDPRTAPNGGFLGWISIRDRPDLGQAVFAHGAGVIGPLESSSGWHIVEILDSRDATPPEERALIARSALEQKALQEAEKELRDRLDVEMQFAEADGGDPHLPQGHPSTEDGEPTEEPADGSGTDASPGEEAKE